MYSKYKYTKIKAKYRVCENGSWKYTENPKYKNIETKVHPWCDPNQVQA
jgi:hypothetical protein